MVGWPAKEMIWEMWAAPLGTVGWPTARVTPEKLAAGGVPLATALETLEKNVAAAKGGKDRCVFFLGANSDAYDMSLMQYTLD